jgi:hypothetical protein
MDRILVGTSNANSNSGDMDVNINSKEGHRITNGQQLVKMEQSKQYRADRYGALVVYPDGARDIMAIAKHEAQKIMGSTEAPKIVDISFNKPLNIYIAIYPYKKVK